MKILLLGLNVFVLSFFMGCTKCNEEKKIPIVYAKPTRVVSIASGSGHNCALLDNGRVRCWGSTTYGMTGYGNKNDQRPDESLKTRSIYPAMKSDIEKGWFRHIKDPAAAGDVELGDRAVYIGAGKFHTCAILESGNVRCWGEGDHGKLGYGHSSDIGDDENPDTQEAFDVGPNPVSITGGHYHTCVLLKSGKVRCWGRNYRGVLGYANDKDVKKANLAKDVDIGGRVVSISTGNYHNCALLDTGKVYCWGYGSEFELGYGDMKDIGDDETPRSVGPVKLGGKAVAISVSGDGYTNCALLSTGVVRCWGFVRPLVKMKDFRASDKITSIQCGDNDNICALFESGEVKCWTDEVGDNETLDSIDSIDLGGDVISIAGRFDVFYAIFKANKNEVKFWKIDEYAGKSEISIGKIKIF